MEDSVGLNIPLPDGLGQIKLPVNIEKYKFVWSPANENACNCISDLVDTITADDLPSTVAIILTFYNWDNLSPS